jgi:hypothetical protein
MGRPNVGAATRFSLSKSEVLLKTELMARTWKAHAKVCEDVELSLSSKDTDDAKTRANHLEYLEALTSLERFAAGIASKRREAFLREPTEWRSTLDAEPARFWIAAYAAFSSTLAELPALNELEYPPETLLTAFEELPDRP